MDFCAAYGGIWQPNRCFALQFAPTAIPIAALQAHKIPDASANSDGFNVLYLTDDLAPFFHLCRKYTSPCGYSQGSFLDRQNVRILDGYVGNAERGVHLRHGSHWDALFHIFSRMGRAECATCCLRAHDN